MKYSSLRTLLTVLPNGKLLVPWSISEGCFRPRFLTKSRLAFTIFNSLLLGLLLIHFAASHFYEPISDQPPNMVFPALFATGTSVVYIVGLQVPMKMGRLSVMVEFTNRSQDLVGLSDGLTLKLIFIVTSIQRI